MPRFTKVIFDLDGTLLDTSPGIMKGLRYALERSGQKVGDDRELYKFIGPPLVSALKDFCGMSDAEARRSTEDYRTYYREKGLFDCAPYPGVEDCLRALHGAGCSMAVATSKPQFFAGPILEQFGLLKYFECIRGASADEHESKADLVRLAMGDLKASADDCVMVGDRKYDILGAKENGIPCVVFASGFAEAGEYEKAGAAAVFESYGELTDYLLSSTQTRA